MFQKVALKLFLTFVYLKEDSTTNTLNSVTHFMWRVVDCLDSATTSSASVFRVLHRFTAFLISRWYAMLNSVVSWKVPRPENFQRWMPITFKVHVVGICSGRHVWRVEATLPPLVDCVSATKTQRHVLQNWLTMHHNWVSAKHCESVFLCFLQVTILLAMFRDTGVRISSAFSARSQFHFIVSWFW
jgi:hypothetical protein